LLDRPAEDSMAVSAVHSAVALAFAAAAPLAAAQTPARADPLDAAASVPQAAHRPAFAGYRRFDEPPPHGWKDANDTVRRIGGWRSYAREAEAVEPRQAPREAEAARPTQPK
jgi:hypothetical protein